MLIGNEEFLLKHKIEKIGEKYYFGSLLRTSLNRDIAMDKLMIDLIENPKKLWKFLLAKVKNSWMEREITRKRLAKKFKNIREECPDNDEIFFEKVVKFLKKWSKKTSFESFLKKSVFLKRNDENFLEEILDGKIIKEISKNSFRVFFVQVIYHHHMNHLLWKIENEKEIEGNEVVDPLHDLIDEEEGKGKKKRRLRGLNDF